MTGAKRSKKSNGSAEPEIAADPLPNGDADLDEADTLELAAETLTGDLRDFILDRLKHEQSKRPWHERSEADQRMTVHEVEAKAQSIVRQAVELIAAQGKRTIRATLEQVTVKEGIKATLTLSRADEERHKLIDATGYAVLIVVADPDDYTGERAPVEIRPDQREIPIDSVSVVHSEPDSSPFH